MINFDKLETKENSSAFVGIKKENSKYFFYLPKGCEIDKKDLKKFYFDIFKLQKKITTTPKKRDGIEEAEGQGASFKENKPIFYSNLNKFLSAFNKTEILGLNTKIVKNEEIDYSQIDKYLDDALYTKEKAPVILETYSPKNIINVSSHDIVKMYCFIYGEIIKNFAEEEVDNVIKKFSKEFKNKYLPYSNTSIFENELVVKECKTLLEKFRKNSLMLKDFKNYYDALYDFFYLEPDNKDGIIAGIDNFWAIWEELCFNYFFKKYENSILYADYEKKGTYSIGNRNNYYVKEDCNNYPFYIDLQIGENSNKIYIYPDLVIRDFCIDDSDCKDYTYEVYLNSTLIGTIQSNKCFTDEELKAENFLITTDNNNFHQIQIKEKIYELLENLFQEDRIENNNKSFKKVEIANTSNEQGCIRISTVDSISKFSERKDYENIKMRNNDYNYLKENLKIERIDYSNSIIDFKYKTKNELSKEDKIKQKLYELALQGNNVKSIFILPSCDSDEKKLITKTEYDNEEDFCYVYFNIKYLLKEYLND